MHEHMLDVALASGFSWQEVPTAEYLAGEGRPEDFLKATLGISSDEAWAEQFMDNWNHEHFHIYLFRWSEYNMRSASEQVEALSTRAMHR